jgi:hypothetical protein
MRVPVVAHPTTAAGRIRDFRLTERIAINEQMGMAKAKADTLYGSTVPVEAVESFGLVENGSNFARLTRDSFNQDPISNPCRLLREIGHSESLEFLLVI